MSAIFGFQYRDGRVADPVDLNRISERLSHRGRDGSGNWNDRSVGLGQRLLHTTPESLVETWPIIQGDGRLVLVADARIDNRDELLIKLDMPRGRTITDGELILSAYQKWGRESPEKLIGDFAYALWDAERNVLFCARDPMGVKPFYYHVSDRLFVFASEIKGLFCLPEVPQDVDEVQIAYFLDWFRDDPERTLYRNVLRLPASHWLEVDSSRVRTGVYWMADPTLEIRYSTNEQYVDAFREHFEQAVSCRLRSAFPVGSALSGGLDSSSIVCTARKLLDKNREFHVVSAEFPGLPEPYRQWNDETRYIDAVIGIEGIVSHRVRADELGLFDYLDRMFWYHDVPPFGFMYWMRWAVYEAAHAHDVRVLFSGDDGDTVVSHGYERFLDLAREGRWTTAIEELVALGERMNIATLALSNAYLTPHLTALARAGSWKRWKEGSSEIARGLEMSQLQLMSRSVAEAFTPQQFVALSRRLRGKRPNRTVVSSEFARRINLEERKRSIRKRLSGPIPTGKESHAHVLPSPMLQHMMEVTDSIATAFSIETRCPFLDRRLVEFSLAVPSEQKLADGWTRLILRRAMEGILPPEVQWRVAKADLGYNFVSRLQDQDKDRQKLQESLFDEPEVLADYIDMDNLRSLFDRFESNGLKGARDLSGRLYVAAVLARWLRGARNKAVPEPAGLPV